MSPPSEKKSLSFYVREYGKFIIPTWVFPVYVIAWGFVLQYLNPKDIIVWYSICVGPLFFGTAFWAGKVRKHIPYFKFVFLTMVIPFLIFTTMGILLAIEELLVESLYGGVN